MHGTLIVLMLKCCHLSPPDLSICLLPSSPTETDIGIEKRMEGWVDGKREGGRETLMKAEIPGSLLVLINQPCALEV